MNLNKFVPLAAFQTAMNALEYEDQEYVRKHILRSCRVMDKKKSAPRPIVRKINGQLVDAKTFHWFHQSAASAGRRRTVCLHHLPNGRVEKELILTPAP